MTILNKNNASLTLIGSGIKSISHLTVEAKAYIQKSAKLLYLVNEPLMEAWIKKTNPTAKSLDFLYKKHPLRIQCYREITQYILEQVRQIQHVCVVMYGHPTVFAQPGLAAIKLAREEGFSANILPGISAEDCLFSDLLIDPGEYGCQSFETTDFLLRLRQVDSTSHLILWQIGMIGILDHDIESELSKINVLITYLLNFYPKDHLVTVYEAAHYPHVEPKITTIILTELIDVSLSSLSTLYVPPTSKKTIDDDMLKKLGISREKLFS